MCVCVFGLRHGGALILCIKCVDSLFATPTAPGHTEACQQSSKSGLNFGSEFNARNAADTTT